MTGLFRTSFARTPMRGHRTYSGPSQARVTNRMAEARAEYLAEKAARHAAQNDDARRALYAGCERAPMGWDQAIEEGKP